MVTRAVGTAQPPVSASAGNATVIGVAGAAFDTITQVDTSPRSLADTRIAFTKNPTEKQNQIFLTDPDGTNLKQLTSNTNDFGPALSPDGTKIAFASNRNDNLGIYVKNIDGTGEKQLTNRGSLPAWSPDGTRIAFDDYGVFVMNADGSGFTQLATISQGDRTFPAWSPDESKIAFQRYELSVGHYQIWVMASNGANLHRISDGTGEDYYPSWSPDGSRIAFASGRAGQDGSPAGRLRIWTMNPDGTKLHQVTRVTAVGPGAEGDYHPAWSPDGSALVFTGARALATGLYVGTFGPDATIAQPKLIPGTVNIGAYYGHSWSGYLPRVPKKLVGGSGGLMASSAAGFLFSQANSATSRSKVASVVTFDTATTNRVNTRVAKLSDSGNGSAAVFTVTAGDGTLNNLRYMNSVDGKMIQAVGTSAVPSAAGILVSFDGADGSVAMVLPYNATKAAGRVMKPEREGDTLVFRGDFAGAWNGKGENAAPGGAHTVKIDAKTGRLVEAR